MTICGIYLVLVFFEMFLHMQSLGGGVGATFFSCYEFKLFFFKTIIGFVRRNYFEDNFICEGTRVQTFKQSKYDFNFKEKITLTQCHLSATTLCIDADMK